VLRKVQPQGDHKPLHVLTKLEFHDLWHKLNVPNEVDLLKQLQSGLLSQFACVLTITLYPLRWFTRDCIGGPGYQDAGGQEERQKVRDPTTYNPTYKYTLEGYGYRSQ
jgi:hypothetical protein